MSLWPCHKCGNPGVRNLGTSGYCSAHLAQLYATFDPAVFALNGIMLQTGIIRSDYGSTYAECTCCACGAISVAVIGEPCQWCQQARHTMTDDQITLVLRPPEHRTDDSMRVWAQRLANAVKIGLIDEQQALNTMERNATRAA